MRTLLLAILLSLLAARAAAACPSCKDALSTPGAPNPLSRGYARSIHLLMAMPYILFGGVAFTIVRSSKRARK